MATRLHYCTLSDMVRAGALDMYRSLPRREWRDTIDQECCTEATCPYCGHIGLVYHPYQHRITREYRAVRECLQCQFAEEF